MRRAQPSRRILAVVDVHMQYVRHTDCQGDPKGLLRNAGGRALYDRRSRNAFGAAELPQSPLDWVTEPAAGMWLAHVQL